MNKVGGVGGFLTMIVAMFIIAGLLVVFVFVAGPIKAFSEKPAANVTFGDTGEEKSFFDYMDSDGFFEVTTERFDDSFVRNNGNVVWELEVEDE
jgi:hypothetical protein